MAVKYDEQNPLVLLLGIVIMGIAAWLGLLFVLKTGIPLVNLGLPAIKALSAPAFEWSQTLPQPFAPFAYSLVLCAAVFLCLFLMVLPALFLYGFIKFLVKLINGSDF